MVVFNATQEKLSACTSMAEKRGFASFSNRLFPKVLRLSNWCNESARLTVGAQLSDAVARRLLPSLRPASALCDAGLRPALEQLSKMVVIARVLRIASCSVLS